MGLTFDRRGVPGEVLRDITNTKSNANEVDCYNGGRLSFFINMLKDAAAIEIPRNSCPLIKCYSKMKFRNRANEVNCNNGKHFISSLRLFLSFFLRFL